MLRNKILKFYFYFKLFINGNNGYFNTAQTKPKQRNKLNAEAEVSLPLSPIGSIVNVYINQNRFTCFK